MSALFTPPTEEQQHLLSLLLSADERNVQLGLTLLLSVEDKTLYTRALALVAAHALEVSAVVGAFLQRYLSAHWALVRPELACLEWLVEAIGDVGEPIDFLASIPYYERYRTEYEYYFGFNAAYARFYSDLSAQLYQLGKRDKALSYMGRLLRHFPESAPYLYRYAGLLEETPATRETRRHYLERAANSPSATPPFLYKLGELYWKEYGDLKQGLQWFKAIVANPNWKGYASGWLPIAHLSERLMKQVGDPYWAQALHALDQYLALQPKNRPVLEHYTWFLLHHQQAPDQARALTQQLHQLAPYAIQTYAVRIAVHWYGFQEEEQAKAILQQVPAYHQDNPLLATLRQAIQHKDRTPPLVPALLYEARPR